MKAKPIKPSGIESMEVKYLIKRNDVRGFFVEVIRADEGLNLPITKNCQLCVSITEEGKERGNHYHKRKTEWFCVLHGKMKLCLQDVMTGRYVEIEMSRDNPVVVKIPPFVAHKLKNEGAGDMNCIMFSNEIFNESDADICPFYDFGRDRK